MNPITAFLVFVLVLAGLAAGQWVNLHLALPVFIAAAIVAASLNEDPDSRRHRCDVAHPHCSR